MTPLPPPPVIVHLTTLNIAALGLGIYRQELDRNAIYLKHLERLFKNEES